MDSTTIVRRIDDLGRIVIPKQIRNELKLKTGDALELALRESGEIVIRKFEEPDLSIKKTEFGVEALMNKKGEVLCIKQKITCEDMANALGMSFSRE